MNRTHLIVVIAFTATTWMLPHVSRAVEPAVKTEMPGEEERRLSRAANNLGFTLFRELHKSESKTNICISPLSISLALSMAYHGANGDTKSAMERVLNLSGFPQDHIPTVHNRLLNYFRNSDADVQMEIANSIWYRNSFIVKDGFIALNGEYYDAEIAGLDFGSPNSIAKINGWVKQKTQGKIPDIVHSIDPLTMMFIINAIYFKGSWTHPFDELETQSERFFLDDGAGISCPMMVQSRKMYYLTNDLFQAVELPYGKQLYSMVVFLPHAGTSADSIINMLDRETWDAWIDQLADAEGTLFLPRFKFAYDVALKKQLSALGMEMCFSPKNADFGGISDEYLYIGEVKHKAFIETNEEGTEAAAVTSVEMKTCDIPNPSPRFTMRVDRPFIFAIREHRTGAILFLGKVVDPTQE